MKWIQGDKYYIHYRDYKISRARVCGEVKYSAWYQHTLLGVFNTVEDAKLVVEQHEAGLYPRGGITYAATVGI